MDSSSNSNIPQVKVSRKWSEEAVRGSVQSSLHRLSSERSVQEEEPLVEDDTTASLIDEWLSHQETEDVSTVIYAVSTLSTPISSPANSDDSSTFATQAGLSQPTMDSLMPPGSTVRPAKKNPKKRPREPTVNSTENDLLGVGSFADGQRPRYASHFHFPSLYNTNLLKLIQDRR